MRRFEESRKNDLERSIKLGHDNAECLRQMPQWCKHIKIRRVSEGLYAQITGLPIATHSISCSYIDGETHAMNLRSMFSSFLVQQCFECAQHSPNGNTSWAQKIINDHQAEKQKNEQIAKEETERISRLRSDLYSKSRNITIEAEPESYRILKFLEDMFSEEESLRKEAAERLTQSARIGPDLFPDAAIDLILVLAGSEEFSALVLPICVELAGKRPGLSERFCKIALDNILKGLKVELSASILVALGDSVAYPLSEACIARLLLSQNHYHPLGGWKDGEPDYVHSTLVLVRSFDAEPQSVQSVIRRELQKQQDYIRIQLCGALKLIQKERPQIILNLLNDLMRSVGLYEDERLGIQTPSGQIVHILQAAFRHSPKQVDQFLGESMERVRPAVQEDIIRVYRDQFFDRTVEREKRFERKNRDEVSECEEVAIQRLLTWAKDDRLEIDVRTNAFEALKIACSYATAGVLMHFVSLLGYYAIISGEEYLPATMPKILLPGQEDNNPQLEQLNEFNRRQQWRIFKQELRKCLKEICEARPSAVFDSVSGCLSQSFEHIEEDFKACCIVLLGEIGKDYQLRSYVLPLIWRALMDYSSAWVRAVAIDAAVEMFSYSSAIPPTNLVDVIIVHLQDAKVVVHQAALRAVTWRPTWFDNKQAIEVLTCLAAHLKVYHDDKYQVDDICDGILSIGQRNEQLKLLALRMVESVFPTGEELVDSKIADNLMRFCKPNEPIADLVAKDIAMYLEKQERDHFDYYRHSSRFHICRWLHELPIETYQQITDTLVNSAQGIAKRDAWEACHFASLFAHYYTFCYEHSVLETAAQSLPAEPKFETFRANLRKLARAAADNAALQEKDVETAKTYFAKKQGEE